MTFDERLRRGAELDLRRRRVPLGAVLVSVVIGVNTVSVVAMLIGL